MFSSSRYFASRAPLLALSAAFGALVALGTATPDARSEDGVRGALAAASGGEVDVFVWEPARSAVSEWFFGRPVLFQAKKKDGLRDIHRAFVRLLPDGTPLTVRNVRNLTNTSRADERSLGIAGGTAVFVTVHDDLASSVTALSLAGAPEVTGFFARARARITHFIETGSVSGLGRVDVLPRAPTTRLTVREVDGKLLLRTEAGTTTLSLARPSEGRVEPHFSRVVRSSEPAPFLHWAADTGRALVGAGPIAWLEGRVFGALDRFHQATDYVARGGETPEVRPMPPPLAAPVTAPNAEVVWPPKRLAPRLSTALPTDGAWRPVLSKLLPKERNDPPLFFRTIVHPDEARPYAEVHLVAFDTRRLDLGMRAGYEDPHPETGPPGSGHVPNDPAFTSRLVATFNGAFKAVHGQFGMQAEGRLLVAPVPGAATVRVDRDGRVGFGDFPADPRALEIAVERGLVAFRQNLDPLVAFGVKNPRGRRVWGDHLYGESVATERSALCVTEDGQLVYAWAKEAAGETMIEALVEARCTYGVHLDMNPGHCQFAFHRMRSFQPLVAEGEILDPRMEVNPNRFLRWSPKDFFTVTLRSSLPEASTLTWTDAPGEAPSLPLALGTRRVGGVLVEVDRASLDALALEVVPGREDAKDELVPGPPDDALVAWNLGHRSQGTRTGLAVHEKTWAPLRRGEATLVLKDGAQPEILPPGVPVEPSAGTSLVQLPVLARDGALTELASQLGDHRRRAALCIDASGHLLVGRAEFDTLAPLVEILLEEGCTLVVALDRGSHHPAFVARRGTERPIPGRLDESLLVARARPLRARGYVWKE